MLATLGSCVMKLKYSHNNYSDYVFFHVSQLKYLGVKPHTSKLAMANAQGM